MRGLNKRKAAVSLALAAAFAAMQVTGYQISMHYGTTVHQSELFQKIGVLTKTQCVAAVIITFAFWSGAIYLLLCFLDAAASETGRTQDAGIKKAGDWLRWLLTAAALFAFWIPCFLAGYPGFYNYDAFSQVPQALYEEVGYSAHHPLIHTLLMGKVILFGLCRGRDLNDGIALYSIFQMAFCALCFSYVVCYIRRISGRAWLYAGAFLYYALFPLIPMSAISTTKDTMFSALLQISIILVYEMCRDIPACLASKRKAAGLAAVLVFMCLFRKNGVYAAAGVLLFILILYRESRKQIMLLLAAVLLLSVSADRALVWTLDAEEGSAEEMLSVPMQQVARVYRDCGEEAFSEEELDLIYQGISRNAILDYTPFLADNIKNYFDFNVILNHKAEFLRIWIEKGIKHPFIYLRAFLDNTYQAWYPGTSVYDEPGKTETAYFSLGMCAGGYRDSRLPGLLVFYEKIASGYYYQKIPAVRLLFSMGAMLWVVLFMLGYAVYKKKRHLAAAEAFILCYCITLFLGPVSLIRYYLILFYCFPVNICYLFSDVHFEHGLAHTIMRAAENPGGAALPDSRECRPQIK